MRKLVCLVILAMVASGLVFNQPVVRAEGGVCRLDKIATWSEQAGGSYRIEAGGNGIQHIDFYPAIGVKTVSYIVPIREPETWWGFGSAWEGNGPECQSFDYVADARGYAIGRLNNGHSGLVVDLRGTPTVVANVASLGQSEIDSLLAVHRQGQAGVSAPSAPAVATVTVVAPAPTPSGSCNAVRQGDSDNLASVTAKTNETLSVEAWGGNLGDAFVVVPATQTVTRNWQRGAIWSYPCTDLNYVLKDVSGRGRTVYLVVNGQLVTQ